MPTFYKYAARQAGSQVNWAGLGVDMAESLAETEKIREQKRVAIDDATNKTLEQLANAPKGEALDGNQFVTNAADDMTKALLVQHKLMKSGRLDPKDYILFNTNIKSGTNQLFNLQKEYQKQYSEKMERLKSTDPKTRSQALEADYMGWLEAFGDLSKSKAIVNPANGQINVGLMEYDKNNVLQPTGKIMTVQDVYKGIAQKFNYFDVMGTSKTISDQLADVVMTSLNEGSITKKGQLITLDYALQEPNTVKAMENYVDSYLENPYNISSLLTDSIGGYENEFSEDGKKKSSGNKIVWKIDKFGSPSTEFTPEQRKAAKEYLIQQTKAQIAKKEAVQQFESAQVKARELSISQQKANTAEAKTTTQGAGSTVDPRVIIKKVTFADTNKDGKVDENWVNPTREINTLNQSYGRYGYQFSISTEDPTSLVIAKAGQGKGSTHVVIPMRQGTMDAIYEYIVNDKAAHPKEMEAFIPKTTAPETGKKVIKGF